MYARKHTHTHTQVDFSNSIDLSGRCTKSTASVTLKLASKYLLKGSGQRQQNFGQTFQNYMYMCTSAHPTIAV